MNNTENYIAIMIESLNKKIQVLDRIIELNAIQNRLLNEEKLDLDKFKENVDAKSVYVDELTKLDNGFSALYDRVKEILSTRRACIYDRNCNDEKTDRAHYRKICKDPDG